MDKLQQAGAKVVGPAPLASSRPPDALLPKPQLVMMSAPGMLPGSAFLQRALPGSVPLAPNMGVGMGVAMGGAAGILGSAPPPGGFPLGSLTPGAAGAGGFLPSGSVASLAPSMAGGSHASLHGGSIVPSKVVPLDVPTVVRTLTGHRDPLSSGRSSGARTGRSRGGAVRSFEDPHLLAVRAVMLRELHVQRLAAVCRKYAAATEALVGAAQLPSQLRQLRRVLSEHRAEIEMLVATVRMSTLDVVETICRWRDRDARARASLAGASTASASSSSGGAEHGRRAASPVNYGLGPNGRKSRGGQATARSQSPPASAGAADAVAAAAPDEPQIEFTWKGRNYLLQVSIDAVQVLAQARIPLRSWIGVDPRGNPTLSPSYAVSSDDAIPANSMQLLARHMQLRHPKWSEAIEHPDSVAAAVAHAAEPLGAPPGTARSAISSSVWSAGAKPALEHAAPPASRGRAASRGKAHGDSADIDLASDFSDYDGVEANALAAGIDPVTVAVYTEHRAPTAHPQQQRGGAELQHAAGEGSSPQPRLNESDIARLRTAHAVVARAVTDAIRGLLENQERDALRMAALEEEARARAEAEAKRDADEAAREMDEKMRSAFVPTIVMRLDRSDPAHIDPRSLKYRLDLYDMYPPELDAPPQTPTRGMRGALEDKPAPAPAQHDSPVEVSASVEQRLDELRAALRTPPDGSSRREHMLKLLGVIDDMYAPEGESDSATSSALAAAFETKSPDASRRASLAGHLSTVLTSVDDAMAEIEKELAYRRQWADMNFCSTKIQAIWRGFHQRLLYAIKVRVENAASRAIQSCFRGYTYRKRMGSLLGLRRASTRIANWWRTRMAKRRVADLKRHALYARRTAESAVLMQAAIRGALARRRVTGIRRVANLVQRCVKLAAGIKAENLAGLGDLLVRAYSTASARGREAGAAADGAITYTLLLDGLRPVLLIMQAVLTLVAPMAWRLRGVRPSRKMVTDPIGSMAQIVQAQGGFAMTSTEERNALALPGVDVSSHVNPLLGPFGAAAQAAVVPSMLPPGIVGPVFSEDRGAWVCFRIQALTNDIMGRTSGLLLTPTALAAASASLLDSSVQRLAGNLALISRAHQSGGEDAVRSLPPGPARLASVLPPELRPTAMFLLTWTMAACRIAELTPAYLSERVLKDVLAKTLEASDDILAVSAKKFTPVGDATIPAYRVLGMRPWYLRPRPVVVILSYDLPVGVADHIVRGLETSGGSSFILVDPETEIVGIGIGAQPAVASASNTAGRGLLQGAALAQGDSNGPAAPGKHAIPPPAPGQPAPTLNRYRGNAGAYRRRLLHRLHNVLAGGHDAIVKVALGASAFSRERFMRDIVAVLGLLQPHSVPLIVLVAGIGVTMNTGKPPQSDKKGRSAAATSSVAAQAAEAAVQKAAADARASAADAAEAMRAARAAAELAFGGGAAAATAALADPSVDPFHNDPKALAQVHPVLADDARDLDEVGRAMVATFFEAVESKFMPPFVRNVIFHVWSAPQALEASAVPTYRGSSSSSRGESPTRDDRASSPQPALSAAAARYLHGGPISLPDLHIQARVAQIEDALSAASVQRASFVSAAFASSMHVEKSRLEALLISMPAEKAAAVARLVDFGAGSPTMDPSSGLPNSPIDGALRVCTGITLAQAIEDRYNTTIGYRYSLQSDLASCTTRGESTPAEVINVAVMFTCLLSAAAATQEGDELAQADFLGALKLDDDEQGVTGSELPTERAAGQRIGNMRGEGRLLGGEAKVDSGAAKKAGAKPSVWASEETSKKNYYKGDHAKVEGKGTFQAGAAVDGYVSRKKVWEVGCRLLQLSPDHLAARMAKAVAHITQAGKEVIRRYVLWIEQCSVAWPRAACGNCPLTTATSLPFASAAPLDVSGRLVGDSPGLTLIAHWTTCMFTHLACVFSRDGPALPLKGPQEVLELDEELRWVPRQVPGLIFSSIVHVAAQVAPDEYTAYFAAADSEMRELIASGSSAPTAGAAAAAVAAAEANAYRPTSSFAPTIPNYRYAAAQAASSSRAGGAVSPTPSIAGGPMSPNPNLPDFSPAPALGALPADTPRHFPGGPRAPALSSAGNVASHWSVDGMDGLALIDDGEDIALTVPLHSLASAPITARRHAAGAETPAPTNRMGSPTAFFLNAAVPVAGGVNDVAMSSAALITASNRLPPVVSFCSGPADAFSHVLSAHLRDMRVHTQVADVPVDFVSRLLLRQAAASNAAVAAAVSAASSGGNGLGSPSRPGTRATSPVGVPVSRNTISRAGQPGGRPDAERIMRAIGGSSMPSTPGGPMSVSAAQAGFSPGIAPYSMPSVSPRGASRAGAVSPSLDGAASPGASLALQQQLIVQQRFSAEAEGGYSHLQGVGDFDTSAGDIVIRDACVSLYRESGRFVFVIYSPRSGMLRWAAMPDDPFLLADLIKGGAFPLTAGMDDRERARLREERRRGDRSVHSWAGLLTALRLLVPSVLTPVPDALAVRPFLEASARLIVRPSLLPLFTARRALPCMYSFAGESDGSLVLASVAAFAEAGVGICSGTFRARTIIFRAHVVSGITHGATTITLRVSAEDAANFVGLLPPRSAELALLTSPAATPLDYALCMLDRLGLYDSAESGADDSSSVGLDSFGGSSVPRSRGNSESRSRAPSDAGIAVRRSAVEGQLVLQPARAMQALASQPKSAIFQPNPSTFLQPKTLLVPVVSVANFVHDIASHGVAVADASDSGGAPLSAAAAHDNSMPSVAAGRALSRDTVGLTGSMAICTTLPNSMPVPVAIQPGGNIGDRPVSLVSPLAPSPAAARGNFEPERLHAWASQQDRVAVRSAAGRPPSLVLRIAAGGMGGLLLGTAVMDVAVPAAVIAAAEAAEAARVNTPMWRPDGSAADASGAAGLAASAASAASAATAALNNLARGHKHGTGGMRVRVSIFQPTWLPDPALNRSAIANAPAAGVSAVGVSEHTPDEALGEADQGADDVEKASSWAAVTTRMKAKVIEDSQPGRLIIVVDDLHHVSGERVSARAGDVGEPAGVRHQQKRAELMNSVVRGDVKPLSIDDAVAVFSEHHQLLVSSAVVFEVNPLERVALLGGHRCLLPRLTPGNARVRSDEQLQAFGRARQALVTAIAARTLAADINPVLVAERSNRNSPMLLRSLLSSAAQHAAEVSFDRAILRQTFKPTLTRTLQADIRLPEQPDTFARQVPDEAQPDAMTSYAMSAAGVTSTGAGPKRRLKAIPLDGLHIFVREGGTAFGTISVPGAELRGILQRARAEAERRAGKVSKDRGAGRPPSSLSHVAPDRSNTPKSTAGRPTAGGFSPSVGAGSVAGGSIAGTLGSLAGAAVSAVLKAPTLDEMLGLQTSWPRTAEQLLQESAQEAAAIEAADTAALQAGELVTPAQEAARASLAAAIAAGTPPVPSSLVLQAKALMARVPEIVAEREGGS